MDQMPYRQYSYKSSSYENIVRSLRMTERHSGEAGICLRAILQYQRFYNRTTIFYLPFPKENFPERNKPS